MASVQIIKYIDIDSVEADMLAAAAAGIDAAVQDSVSWIKNDVLQEQKYIGAEHFPDVKPATKKAKRRRGNTKVLVDTGHYKDSWIGESSGLKGKIQCGTDGYFAKLHSSGWRIDRLWDKHHSEEAAEIVIKAIQKVL